MNEIKNINPQFTELDYKLRELALTDWQKFAELIGNDAIVKAKVCLLRKQKRTFLYICYRLKISKSKAENAVKKCPDCYKYFPVKQETK